MGPEVVRRWLRMAVECGECLRSDGVGNGPAGVQPLSACRSGSLPCVYVVRLAIWTWEEVCSNRTRASMQYWT
jgi:hypothetical protein